MAEPNRKLWLVNRLTSLLPKPRFEASKLLQAATRQEGESEFGDRYFEDGLEVLLRSLEDDARLSPMGRVALHRMIVRMLATRLRLNADRRRRPEVYAKSLTPPILILGMPRAGTTFLHRLLSAMPDARPARTWEINQPLAPRSGDDDRHHQASRQVAMIRKLMPELDDKHRLDPDDPDECVMLLNPSFHSIAWWMFAPVYSYLDWLLDQDMAPAYAEYHDYLRALQAAQRGRFVLKAPAHTGYLAEIVAACCGCVAGSGSEPPAASSSRPRWAAVSWPSSPMTTSDAASPRRCAGSGFGSAPTPAPSSTASRPISTSRPASAKACSASSPESKAPKATIIEGCAGCRRPRWCLCSCSRARGSTPPSNRLHLRRPRP
jgi:hypothetical protein